MSLPRRAAARPPGRPPVPVAERWAGASAFFLAALHRRVRGRIP